MQIKCRKCGEKNVIKNGLVFAKQRYKCKKCGYQFTKLAPAGKPLFIKMVSHSLYVCGLSMRQIADILGVTAQSVSRWIQKWHAAYVFDMEDKTKLYATTGANVFNFLKIKSEEKVLISTTVLPSGAKFSMIVQLPQEGKEAITLSDKEISL